MDILPMARLRAMPPGLRTLVFQAVLQPCAPRAQQSRRLSTPSVAASKPAPLSQQPLSSLSYLPPPSNLPLLDPLSVAIEAEPPTTESLSYATHLFLKQPPHLLYTAPRFLNVPINSHMPEICILGRSNVGKSTLINALAGVSTSIAGRAHGTIATRNGLAITSARAGCTKTLNAFAFGPAMSVAPKAKGDGDEERPAGKGRMTRSQKRSKSLIRERMPRHSFILMDMPGYGQNSRLEWGVEIQKYLTRRSMLRGAIILVDAVVGMKDGDRSALRLLRDAGVHTTIVLTKADKLVSTPGLNPDGTGEAVRRQAAVVWEELRDLEQQGLAWSEGQGWDSEVWVTGAGDPGNGALGLAGVRFVIGKMAGLVEDRRTAAGRKILPAGTAGSKIVPFDQIPMGPSRAVEQRWAA